MSIAELKDEAKSWNLGSDSKLLEYLQQFSAGVTDRTKSFAEKVDDLAFDVVDSEVSLKNTFNEFLMLGNSQFIENVRFLASHAVLFALLLIETTINYSAFTTMMTRRRRTLLRIPKQRKAMIPLRI